MGNFIFDQGSINTAALTVPGAYTQLMANNSGGANFNPSNVIALVGAASYGPVNTPMPFSDSGSAALLYGQFNYLLNDPYDMMLRVLQAFQQSQTGVNLTALCVRITDGTDVAATYLLKDTTSGTPLTISTLSAKYTGTGGNGIKVIVSQGNGTNLFNVTIVASFGGANQTESFTNILGGTAGVFATNLYNALTQGQFNVRGPSQLIVPGTPNETSINPALGTYSLTGGTDGRSGLTSASFFGTNTVGAMTGIYALQSQAQLKPAYLLCCGLTDLTKAATLQVWASQNICRILFPLPAGTPTLTAITDLQTTGIADKRFIYLKDWLYWTDPVSGKLLFQDPGGLAIGALGALSPQYSPLNKPVLGVEASEHTANYTDVEIGLCNSNGILVISNPVEGGSYWGFLTGNTTSQNPDQQPIEYSRLQDWVGQQGNGICGQFVGAPQGLNDPDPTRSACSAALNDMFIRMQQAGLIDQSQPNSPAFLVQCDSKLNTGPTIRARYMYANAWYRPLGSIEFVVVNLYASITNTAPFAATA